MPANRSLDGLNFLMKGGKVNEGWLTFFDLKRLFNPRSLASQFHIGMR